MVLCTINLCYTTSLTNINYKLSVLRYAACTSHSAGGWNYYINKISCLYANYEGGMKELGNSIRLISSSDADASPFYILFIHENRVADMYSTLQATTDQYSSG